MTFNTKGGAPDDRPLLKVKSDSDPSKVAGAVAGYFRQHGRCELQAIGAAAVNQAVKAVAIARGYVAPQGYNLVMTPAFVDLQVDGEERTALRIIVENK